jgi:hypothetical protein
VGLQPALEAPGLAIHLTPQGDVRVSGRAHAQLDALRHGTAVFWDTIQLSHGSSTHPHSPNSSLLPLSLPPHLLRVRASAGVERELLPLAVPVLGRQLRVEQQQPAHQPRLGRRRQRLRLVLLLARRVCTPVQSRPLGEGRMCVYTPTVELLPALCTTICVACSPHLPARPVSPPQVASVPRPCPSHLLFLVPLLSALLPL